MKVVNDMRCLQYTLVVNGRWQYTLLECSAQLKERRCEGGLKTHCAVWAANDTSL